MEDATPTAVRGVTPNAHKAMLGLIRLNDVANFEDQWKCNELTEEETRDVLELAILRDNLRILEVIYSKVTPTEQHLVYASKCGSKECIEHIYRFLIDKGIKINEARMIIACPDDVTREHVKSLTRQIERNNVQIK